MWMWDAAQGYHQISIKPASQEKLAFLQPRCHEVDLQMPFGPVNRPATFIAFIHDGNAPGRSLLSLMVSQLTRIQTPI
jgi:hypothetical protein